MAGYVIAFDRDDRGKYLRDAGYVSIVYGTYVIHMEDAMNEMQWLQFENQARFVRGIAGSGVLEKNINNLPEYSDIDYSIGAGTSPILAIANFEASFDGYLSKVTNTNFSASERVDGKNMITLSPSPNSLPRYDLVYIEMWFEEVKAGSVIYRNGTDGADAVVNYIDDPREEEETDRRVQLRSRIMVVDDVDFTDNTYGIMSPKVKVRGGNSTATLTPFRSADYKGSNIFVAGNGDSSDKTLLKSVTGYVYSMGLFKIRRNVGSDVLLSDITDLRKPIRDLGEISDFVNSHIYSRDDQHGLADGSHHGFLSKEMYSLISDTWTAYMTRLESNGSITDHYHSADRDWNNIKNHVNFPAYLNAHIQMSSEINSTSEIIAGNLKGVKIAYDKGVEGLNRAITVEGKINAHTANSAIHTNTWRPISDSVTSEDSNTSASSKAGKICYDASVTAFAKGVSAYNYADVVNGKLVEHINDSNLHGNSWRPISDTFESNDSSTSISKTAGKAIWDASVKTVGDNLLNGSYRLNDGKLLKFGTGEDVLISWDDTNSALVVNSALNSSKIRVIGKNASGSTIDMMRIDPISGVSLYYGGNVKALTSTGGLAVTGTISVTATTEVTNLNSNYLQGLTKRGIEEEARIINTEFRIETRGDDPISPATGRMWLRSDIN